MFTTVISGRAKDRDRGDPLPALGSQTRASRCSTVSTRFGLFEISAIGSAEWLRRHLAIINELETIRRENGRETLDILDFGGADGSLARAMRLYGLERHYRVVVADIEAPVDGMPLQVPVTGFVLLDPGGDLPLDAESIDVAVSSDVFEHIPAGMRRHWASELGRVSRLAQVHSMPADGGGGKWTSTVTDQRFAEWYRGQFAEEERWTAEHLANGAPTIEELRTIFPNATVSGIVNSAVWLAMMRAKYGRKGPLDRVTLAVKYAGRYRSLERRPPFKNAPRGHASLS